MGRYTSPDCYSHRHRVYALFDIRRKEYPRHRVVVARPIVVQSRERVGVLPGETFGRGDGSLGVAIVSIQPEKLVAPHGGSARSIGEGRDQAALRVGRAVEASELPVEILFSQSSTENPWFYSLAELTGDFQASQMTIHLLHVQAIEAPSEYQDHLNDRSQAFYY